MTLLRYSSDSTMRKLDRCCQNFPFGSVRQNVPLIDFNRSDKVKRLSLWDGRRLESLRCGKRKTSTLGTSLVPQRALSRLHCGVGSLGRTSGIVSFLTNR